MAALGELRIRCTRTPLLYTLYLTGSPPVLEGAVQCKFSWSHLSGGGVITSPVGAPGTVGTCIYIQSMKVLYTFKQETDVALKSCNT